MVDFAFSFVKRFKFEKCSICGVEITLEKEMQGYPNVD